MKQGPQWEADIVKDMNKQYRHAERIDKSGERGRSDIRVDAPIQDGGYPPTLLAPVFLAWKRYFKGGKRRRSEKVVVMSYDDWKRVMGYYPSGFWVEAKAAQAVSVTTVLAKAIKKVREQ